MKLIHTSRLIIDRAIQEELNAFYLYRSLANSCQALGLFGAMKYFIKESGEELSHYQRHVDFLNQFNETASLPLIEPSETVITDLAGALSAAMAAEDELGKLYAGWYQSAASDPSTQQHLLQFLEIQRNSSGEYGDWINRLRLCEDVILIDQELGVA